MNYKMKYITYISILLFTLFRKVFGLVWYFPTVPFRKYANNVVFNYALQNKIYLKRLLEKDIRFCDGNYIIASGHGSDGGYINYRKISWLEYKLVYWFIWGWLDADSYCDTTSESYLKEFLADERGGQLHADKELEECLTKCQGNSFDRGDAIETNWCEWLSIMWNIRNTAYNFKYMQYDNPNQTFYFTLGSWEFGWARLGELNGVPNYRLVFGPK